MSSPHRSGPALDEHLAGSLPSPVNNSLASPAADAPADSDFDILQREIRNEIDQNPGHLTRILGEVARSTQSFFNADGIAIALETDGVVLCRMSAGAAAPEIGTALNVDSGISGICYREKTSQYCIDTRADHRVDPAACDALGIRSLLVSPVVAQERIVGLIELFSATDYSFGAGDVQALETIAALVSRAYMQADATSETSDEAAQFGATRRDPMPDASPATPLDSADRVLAELRSSAVSPTQRAGRGFWRQPRTRRLMVIALLVTLILIAGTFALQRLSGGQWALSTISNNASPKVPPDVTTVYVMPQPVPKRSDVPPRPQHGTPATVAVPTQPAVAPGDAQPPAPSPQRAAIPANTVPSITLPAAPNRVETRLPVSLSGSSAAPNVQKSAPTQPNASNEVVASADRGNPEAVAAPAVKETPPQVVLGTPEDSPPPVYPQIAKIARVQGQVILLATVDKSGLVRDVSVVSGHPMLTAAATKAVSQWRYKPYLLNGKPVDAETRVTINFKLPQ